MTAAPAAILVNRCDVRLWNLSQEDRLRRSLARAGAGVESTFSPTVLLLRADFAIDDILIKALVAAPDCILVSSTNDDRVTGVAAHVPREQVDRITPLLLGERRSLTELAAAGLAVRGPEELASSYNHALRKRAVPYLMSLTDHVPLAVERRMFKASYKGVTDFVTKWLWPWPAFWATRWCAARGISPNIVTAVSLVLVLAAMWLFWRGDFGLGLVAAWLMTFLDTVDGKLARVTLTSSRIGNVFDHGIDLVHPPFWYAAWYFGLTLGGTPTQNLLLAGALWTAVIGYVVGRLQEGFFLWRYRVEMHAWRPVDSTFRLFTARRNPNLALMTVGAVAGRPDLGLVAVAVWTVLSLLFHFLRIAQALRQARAGAPVRSWLAEPA